MYDPSVERTSDAVAARSCRGCFTSSTERFPSARNPGPGPGPDVGASLSPKGRGFDESAHYAAQMSPRVKVKEQFPSFGSVRERFPPGEVYGQNVAKSSGPAPDRYLLPDARAPGSWGMRQQEGRFGDLVGRKMATKDIAPGQYIVERSLDKPSFNRSIGKRFRPQKPSVY